MQENKPNVSGQASEKSRTRARVGVVRRVDDVVGCRRRLSVTAHAVAQVHWRRLHVAREHACKLEPRVRVLAAGHVLTEPLRRMKKKKRPTRCEGDGQEGGEVPDEGCIQRKVEVCVLGGVCARIRATDRNQKRERNTLTSQKCWSATNAVGAPSGLSTTPLGRHGVSPDM